MKYEVFRVDLSNNNGQSIAVFRQASLKVGECFCMSAIVFVSVSNRLHVC